MIGDIESASPALCRLQLGSELRQLRAAATLSGVDVVRMLSWAPSKLTRLETADTGSVEPSDVMALCQIYGADSETQATLMGYARVTKTKKDWWQEAEYRPLVPPGLKAYLGLEAAAAQLHTYQAEFVPGLLQTEAYVRAIYGPTHNSFSEDELDRLVQVRVTRQEVLHRESPLKLSAIINEAVLHRAVGGTDVMRAQLAHMAEIATLPHVNLQVVPYRVGVHPGMNGPFTVLHFAALQPIVYLENLAAAGVIRRQDEVERYEDVFGDLQRLAPGPQESLSMIQKASKEF
jgi:hypothetical protein